MIKVDHSKFIFTDLPEYSKWLKENHLSEFVSFIIKCSKEENLPLLKALNHLSEEQLTALSLDSNKETFEALATNTIDSVIQRKLDLWINNALVIVDKDQIVAEDITITSYIRRKAFYHFIDRYTNDITIFKKLINEIDTYTTHEELVLYTSYIHIQQEKLRKTNEELALHETLLLEAQEIAEMGSYLMDFTDRSKSLYTPQYKKILEVKDNFSFEVFMEGVHPLDKEATRNTIQEALSKGGELEVEYRYLANGKVKRIWSKGVAVLKDGKAITLKGTIRDVTRKHELLKQLQESNKLHRLAQELTHLGNWTWEIETNKITWSDEMYRIYGMEPQSEEITFERFTSLIHPDYREKRIKEINESLETLQSPDYILSIVTPGGIQKMLKGHGWIETDYKNEPIKLHGTCQDITKEYALNKELLLLNETLSNKNAELERINTELESFNYIASHDLKEPLRKIRTFISLLLEEHENISERGLVFINKVISSATTMQKLISDLIDFSQVNSVKESFEKTDLVKIIEDVKNSLSDSIEESGAIIRVNKLPEIIAIRFQFIQLFTNIIGNAIKYKKEDVVPEIDIDSRIVKGETLTIPKAKESEYIQITIRDNGIGFDQEYKEKIFDLFQRLHSKENYSGTGIGLAICKKIVQQHNGFIEAESEKGKGSTFNIFLPASVLIN